MVKKILIGLLVIFIIIQFIRPAKNQTDAAQPKDIAAVYPVPANVHEILKRACYDCHSNNTKYPWYNNVQPVTWWLNHHISEGKHELNFNEFVSYTKKKKRKRLNQVADAVTDGWMPLKSYLWIHKEAVLTKEESDAVAEWANTLADHIDSTEAE